MDISFLEFYKVAPIVPESKFVFVFSEYFQYVLLQKYKFYQYNLRFENILLFDLKEQEYFRNYDNYKND